MDTNLSKAVWISLYDIDIRFLTNFFSLLHIVKNLSNTFFSGWPPEVCTVRLPLKPETNCYQISHAKLQWSCKKSTLNILVVQFWWMVSQEPADEEFSSFTIMHTKQTKAWLTVDLTHWTIQPLHHIPSFIICVWRVKRPSIAYVSSQFRPQ